MNSINSLNIFKDQNYKKSNRIAFKSSPVVNFNNFKYQKSLDRNDELAFYNRSIYNPNYYGITFGNIQITPAKRLHQSNYEINSYIREIGIAKSIYGNDGIIDLGVGNPDLLPPKKAMDSLAKEVLKETSYRYNAPEGEYGFKKDIAQWLDKRFELKNVDQIRELLVTSGIVDSISLILNAYTNPGDKILVPNPGYAQFGDLLVKHDVEGMEFDLKPENNYQPDFNELSKKDLQGVKGIILNYPNNPTGVFATEETLKNAVKFARDNNLFIIFDMDNSEFHYHDEKPMSILQLDGAKDVAFQLHTMSKSFGMPGIRVGFIVGNKDFIAHLKGSKYLSGNSTYKPLQKAASAALKDKKYIDDTNEEYRKRKDVCVQRLRELGCNIEPSQGTFYLWAKLPDGFTSQEFFKYTLHKARVAFTPGTALGKNGEGYIRIVLSDNTDRINEAFDNIKNAGIRFDVPKDKLPEKVQKEIEKISNGEYN